MTRDDAPDEDLRYSIPRPRGLINLHTMSKSQQQQQQQRPQSAASFPGDSEEETRCTGDKQANKQ
jgi:hypothetical protein